MTGMDIIDEFLIKKRFQPGEKTKRKLDEYKKYEEN